MDVDGKEKYVRDCGVSEDDFNDEMDKCYTYERFGTEYHECVCRYDECNGAAAAAVSAVAAAVGAAALRWIVL